MNDGMNGAETAARTLISWLESRHGGEVTLEEPPSSKSEGFDSTIHLGGSSSRLDL